MLLPTGRIPHTLPSLLSTALLYWKQTLKYTKKAIPYSANIPLMVIPTATGIVTTKRLSSWTNEGVSTVGALFIEGTQTHHDNFQRAQGVPPTLFLLHAAVRYIKQHWAPDGSEPPTHALVHAIHLIGEGRHFIRRLYRGIRTHSSTPLLLLRTRWSLDLNREFTDKEWASILEFPKKVSRNASLNISNQ